MYLFCPCFNKQSKINYKTSTDNFDELLRNPTKLNRDLEAAVAEWEQSISSLAEQEEIFITHFNPTNDINVIDFAESIKNNPDDYIFSDDQQIKCLASAAITVRIKKEEIDSVFTKARGVEKMTPGGDVSSPIHERLISTRSDTSSASEASSPDRRPSHLSKWMESLSRRWAGRLQDINHLQGILKTEENKNDNSVTLKVKPTWPEWLVDVSYDVMKRSKYGQLQRKILKLTQFHILNVKNGIEITKSFKYTEVKDIYLHDENSFIIVLHIKNLPDKTMCYFSPLSVHIVQQITTRVKVTLALDKSGFSRSNKIPDSLVGYSIDVTALLIDSIIVDNAKDNVSDLVSFAKMLGERAIPRENVYRNSQGRQSEKSEDSSRPERRSSLNRLSASSSRSSFSKYDAAWTDADAARLIAYVENSNEYKLQNTVQKMMHDGSSPESNTRQNFIDTFTSAQKTIDDIRLWIDGMHEYIITKRGNELVEILDSKIVHLSQANEKLASILSFIVFSVVEETMFVSLKKEIISLISTPESRAEEQNLISRMRALSYRQQKDWGIPNHLVSPHQWRSAVFELAGIERNPTPIRRLNALVRSAKSVYAEFKEHILPNLKEEGKEDTVLSADDLVPIFIYILCQSGLRHPILNRDLLWKICHPDVLHGECGYYLTIYESALQFLIDLNDDDVPLRESIADLSYTYDASIDDDYSVLTSDRKNIFSIRTIAPGNMIRDNF